MRKFPIACALALAGLLAASLATPQSPAATTPRAEQWPTYGGNLASQRYASLDQIDKDNFSKLEVAWRFKTDALGPRPEFNLQSAPLMVGGVLYSTGGTRRFQTNRLASRFRSGTARKTAIRRRWDEYSLTGTS